MIEAGTTAAMARRLRLQFEGAAYHVIHRGNYRRDLFETVDKTKAFERVLFETCERMRWKLYAFVLTKNHFHLAIATREANLVSGMHWLQSTFTTRFNGFRNERGHLVQGRYHSLLVEPGPSLLRVVNYIHLNPVGAHIIPTEQVSQFRWSSLRYFIKSDRPAFLSAEDWLPDAELSDNAAGWSSYVEQLVRQSTEAKALTDEETEALTRGWAIGTPEWRKALAKDYAELSLSPEVPRAERRELKEAHWEAELHRLLPVQGQTLEDARLSPKAHPGKSKSPKRSARKPPPPTDGLLRLSRWALPIPSPASCRALKPQTAAFNNPRPDPIQPHTRRPSRRHLGKCSTARPVPPFPR